MKSVNYLDNFCRLMPIIYPSFYICLLPSSEELVFLRSDGGLESHANEPETTIEGVLGGDKTACEAFANHVHLFEKVGEAGRQSCVHIGKCIARNLLRALAVSFPTKRFIVYLEVNVKDSTIVRFHQMWDDEPPYIDVTQPFENGCELYAFSTDCH